VKLALSIVLLALPVLAEDVTVKRLVIVEEVVTTNSYRKPVSTALWISGTKTGEVVTASKDQPALDSAIIADARAKGVKTPVIKTPVIKTPVAKEKQP
jgi:hypothetical protein